MSVYSAFRICVPPGDGIGNELIDPTVAILEKLRGEVGGFDLSYGHENAGAALPEDVSRRAVEG